MKTKLSFMAALVLFLAAPLFGQVFARPCIAGTLASYIALGPAGCTFDGAVYANFAYLSTTGGITANQIFVDPVPPGPIVVPPFHPGLNFSASWRAAAGQAEQSVIGYTVAPSRLVGPLLSGLISLLLGNTNVAGPIGSVAVTEKTNVGTLSVFEKCAEICTVKKTDQLNFRPVQALHVTDTVSLSGGSGGVSLSGFTATYNLCPLCVEPL